MIGCSLSRMNSLEPSTAPPRVRPWPSMYLVAEWTTMSAPELERPLQDRRGKGVVEHDLGAGLVGEVAHRLHVDDVEHRVGGRFEQHGLRRLAEAPFPTARDRRHRRTRPGCRTWAAGRPRCSGTKPKSWRGRDDAIARLEQRQQREEHRRHAGRGGAAGLGAFQRGQPVLEHADGRIAEARILIVRALALEGGLGLLRARIGVARRSGRAPPTSRRSCCAAARRARRASAAARSIDRPSPSSWNRSVHHALSSRPRPFPGNATKKAPDLEGRGFCEHLRPFSDF